MTNPLEILKTQLKKALDENVDRSDCFKEALHDCCYACNCSTVALEEHMEKWLNGPYNYEYCQGIKFVEEKWHAITGMF